MTKFNVIWKETYFRHIKSGIFLTMVVLPIVIFGIIQLVLGFMTEQSMDSTRRDIGLVSNRDDVTNYLVASDLEFTFIPLTKDEAITQLSEDSIAGYLDVSEQDNQVIATYQRKATSEDTLMKPIEAVLTQFNLQEQAKRLGISLQNVKDLISVQTIIPVYKLNSDDLKNGIVSVDNQQEEKEFVRFILAFGTIMILYIFLATYGSVIGQEIATEKGSRVMEVVLSSVTAKIHFAGKVFGIALVSLTHLLVYAVLALIYYMTSGQELLKGLGSERLMTLAGNMIGYAVVFILLGCVLYIILSALLGSMASKLEDVQKVITPLIIFDVLGLYIGLFGLEQPNNIIVKSMSWFPLFTPMLMPIRIATDTVGALEIFGAMLLMVIFISVIFILGFRFYAANVLMYSDKGPMQVLKQSLLAFKKNNR